METTSEIPHIYTPGPSIVGAASYPIDSTQYYYTPHHNRRLRGGSVHTFTSTPTPAAGNQPPALSVLSLNGASSVVASVAEPPAKRRRMELAQKENLPVTATPLRELPFSTEKRKRKAKQTVKEKLETIWKAIQSTNLTFGEFIFYAFQWKEDVRDGEIAERVSRPHDLSVAVAHFLAGNGRYGVGKVLKSLLTTPDGRDPNEENLWTLSTEYSELKHVREALTSFAAQQVRDRMVYEANNAVKPDSGLHVATSKNTDIAWSEYGSTTVANVQATIMRHQPLTWAILNTVAARPPKMQNGVVAVRKTRPTNLVCTHTISYLNFSRNRRANRLPAALGILYFAFSAPVDLFAYASRTGSMVAYTTAYNMLKGLAQQEERMMKQHGRIKWGGLHIDNTQNYLRMRDPRLGLEHKMSVGIAATWIEYPLYEASGADLDDRAARRASNLRNELSAMKLIGLLDPLHLEQAGMLQWLNILVTSVPALDGYRTHVNMLYKTRIAKSPLPREPSNIHPLATVGKNETISTELSQALVDFMAQTGHTHDDYVRRPLPILGDGLTYQKVKELKEYYQLTHDHEFERFDIVEPVLQAWHTMWTDVTRIYEAHWGEDVTSDPSTISHSARKIGRDAPMVSGKVDYYPGIDLLYLIGDMRMLDCWRTLYNQQDIQQYFAELKEKNALPPVEELEEKARSLYRAYSTTRGAFCALHNVDDPEWRKIVPNGSQWAEEDGTAALQSSAVAGTESTSTTTERPKKSKPNPSRGKKGKKAKVDTAPSTSSPDTEPKFEGDYVLYRNIIFLRDVVNSREALLASTAGDPGRWWEICKTWLFTFAGSSHTKYTGYLLEFVTTLEVESSPELKQALLGMMFVSMNGIDFLPGDLLQEHFNRLLEFISERKGKDFADNFTRNIVSRNLYQMSRLKKDLRDGVGLQQHSAAHSEPHCRPEAKILSRLYPSVELSRFRGGRRVDRSDPDHFTPGLGKLSTKLKGSSTKIPTDDSQTPEPDDNDENVALPGSQSLGTIEGSGGSVVVEYWTAAEALKRIQVELEDDDEEFPEFPGCLNLRTSVDR